MSNNTSPGLASMTQGTIDAYLKLNAVAAGVMERTAKYYRTTTELSLAEILEANRSLMAAKSAVELAELTTKLSRQSMTALLQHGKTLCELQGSIMNEVLMPLSESQKADGGNASKIASTGRKAA